MILTSDPLTTYPSEDCPRADHILFEAFLYNALHPPGWDRVSRALACWGPLHLEKQWSYFLLLHPKLCLWDWPRGWGTEPGLGFSASEVPWQDRTPGHRSRQAPYTLRWPLVTSLSPSSQLLVLLAARNHLPDELRHTSVLITGSRSHLHRIRGCTFKSWTSSTLSSWSVCKISCAQAGAEWRALSKPNAGEKFWHFFFF